MHQRRSETQANLYCSMQQQPEAKDVFLFSVHNSQSHIGQPSTQPPAHMIPPLVDLAETANTRTASLPFELSNCTVEDGSDA